jgi:hypothetical protein
MKADRNSASAIVEWPSGSVSARAFTLWLAIFFIADIVAVNGLEWWLSSGGFADTALQQSWDMLRGVGGDDSWGPMASALAYLQQPHDKPLYQAIFFDQGIKFQYPPSALFALDGMLLFGEDRVRTFDEMVFAGWPPINDLVGWTMLFVTAVSAALLMEIGLRRAGTADRYDGYAALRTLLVFGFTLGFYPAVKAFTLGQIQLWINSIFALGLLLFLLDRKTASGVLMGLVCLMKPHYGLFTVWGALNREWRFTAACVVMGAIGLFFSIWVYGWANHTDYLRVLSFMSERGESFYANQSVNGLLNRLASLSAPELYANVNFEPFRFPPYKAWVYWATIASSAVILLTGLLRKSASMNRGLAFSIVAVSLTLASPIAWEHHYGVLLPVFALMAGGLATYPGRLAALALSYIFVSNFISAFNLLAPTPFNVLQSYTLAGGVALLILMHFHLSTLQAADRRHNNP